ncbi:VIT domain-containing protein [Planctomycetota bacterium]
MKTARMLGVLAVVIAVFGLVAQDAMACRIVPSPMPIIRPMPRPRPRQPLETRSHSADITIKGPVATVAVNAVFYNPNPYIMEGTYFFPLEANAAVDDFQMDINGKMVKGELLDADKARGIYEGIVRKMKDPGLLEFVGTKMLKCRVYPMPANGETKVKLTYSLALKADGGLFEFTYPLRSAKPEAGKIGNTVVRVKVDQADGIKTIYSPTHKVDVKRDGDTKATLGFEQAKLMPERDFKLYFNVSKKDIGLSVVSHKPAGENGYFLLTAAPKVEVKEAEVQAKSIVFVMDTSGSMQGEKIRQAKGALRYCVNSLKPKDSFGIITFATEPTPFRETLIPGSKENVSAAVEFIDKIEARGGTAINDAVLLALKTLKGTKGLPMVVFLTDGLPTIGETNVETILKNVTGANEAKGRIFVFGVGYDVNTKLLDKLAEDNHGAPDYVTEKEDIEVKVSNFYQKVASPVLTDVKLEVAGLKVTEMYPKTLGDLFRGTQLMVLGRFEGDGHKAVKLTGTVNGKARELVFETNFAATKENSFLPRLWATRKVAYLLDAIRKGGKKKELVDEVIRLGKRYGIMTPYTSFLVVEDSARPQVAQQLRESQQSWERKAQGADAVHASKRMARAKAAPPMVPGPAAAEPEEDAGPAGRGGGFRFNSTLGLGREAHGELRRVATTKIVHIGDKTFYQKRDGILYDSVYDEAKQKDEIVEIKAFSDEYFELLKKHEGIGRYLAEGKSMVLVFDGKVYKITT